MKKLLLLLPALVLSSCETGGALSQAVKDSIARNAARLADAAGNIGTVYLDAQTQAILDKVNRKLGVPVVAVK